MLNIVYQVVTSLKVKVLVAQSCLTLCGTIDSNLPGSSVHGILQERILEWVAFPFSRGLPNPGIEPGSPALAGKFLTTSATAEAVDFQTHSLTH